MKYAVLLLALVGCGRYGFSDRVDADAAPDGGSGASTRLKQTWNVFDGGLRQPIASMYDTLLGLQCSPYPTTAGIRCLPQSYSFPEYLDSACTQPAAPKGSPDVQYAFDTRYPPASHAYTFGASLGIPAAVYLKNLDGSCSLGTAPTVEWFAVDEIGFDRFALFNDVLGSEGRLVSLAYVTDDGFRFPTSLHDTMLDELRADRRRARVSAV